MALLRALCRTAPALRGGAMCCALVLTGGCGGDSAPPPGAGGRRPSEPSAEDGGTRPPLPSPRPDGGAILPAADEEVRLPFGGPAVFRTIEVAAAPSVLDLHMSIDTTSSMTGEIDALQISLRTQVMPKLRAKVADVSFGASRFEDFPEPPFGNTRMPIGPDDSPFRLLTPITSDDSRVVSAIASLDQPLGLGGDQPESSAEALYQIATGEGYSVRGAEFIAPFAGRAAVGGGLIGGVGFREGALRAVLHVTDAPTHTPDDYASIFPGTHGLSEAAEALRKIDARLIGIVSACTRDGMGCDFDAYELTRKELVALALATGAVAPPADDGGCPYGVRGRVLPAEEEGCPLVFDIAKDGAGLSTALIDAVAALLEGTRFRVVSAFASADPIGFVTAVRPIPPEAGSQAKPAMIEDRLPDGHPDGEPDSFIDVAANTPIAFELELRNLAIAESEAEQRFRVVIEVHGDDLLLERRTLRIVVPAGTRLAPSPDAALPHEDADAGG